jgi:hypothetical protein
LLLQQNKTKKRAWQLSSPYVFQKKTKEEGDGSKATVAFFFFLLQQNKTKRRGWQLLSPSTMQKKEEAEEEGDGSVTFFFFLL